MRNTGLGTSIGLVAVGAILAWAVTFEMSSIDVNMVGMILFAVGLLGIAVTLAATSTSQRTVIHQDREVHVTPEQVQARQPQMQQPQMQQPQMQQPQMQQPQPQQRQQV